MSTNFRLIYGKGIVDLEYSKKTRLGSTVIWTCPYFERWRGLIRRCYSDSVLKRNPTYESCTVCEEWLTFSNFKSWMETQNWEGKELDKDLLINGNKVYSPETCVWISHDINIFLCDKRVSNIVEFSTGTVLDKQTGMWRAQCSNPFAVTKYERRGYLGLFRTQKEAHLVWKRKKHEHSCKFADSETDERIINALRNRYK